MAEPAGADLPTLAEASAWRGFDVDDVRGSRVGRVRALFADAEDARPAWLIVALGRRRARLVAVPLRDCAGGGGRVWTAHPHEALRDAPVVDPSRPLLREHEITICAHYGIGEALGRAGEVAGREAGSVTSRPA
jgi:hypothetical protein